MTLLDTLNRLASPRLLVLGDLILDRYTWGNAERISPEAPVPVLRVDQKEVRLGGAASVAGLLRSLEARVVLAGVTGEDSAARVLRQLLAETGIDRTAVLCDPDRFATVKERFMGRAAQRHPQQILRVDHELRHFVARGVEEQLAAAVLAELPNVKAVLISDYAKGVCTPALLARVIAAAKELRLPVLIDPGRQLDYARYRGATLLAPNRVETELAIASPVRTSAEALDAGQELCHRYGVATVLIKLDSDGIALVEAGGTGGTAKVFPTRPRAVYDVTGAGDMVLAIAGLCRASGISWEDTVPLANVAAGLEVEKLGVAPITRAEIHADLLRADPVARIGNPSRTDHDKGRIANPSYKQKLLTLAELLPLVEDHRRHRKKIVFTNGCFDLLHLGHAAYLEEAARLGDVLIVAVNSDAGVRKLKGPGRPVIGEAGRAALVAALAVVDHALIFDDDTPHELLRRIRPDVLVKGGTYGVDEVVGKEIVEAYGGTVCVTAQLPGLSSSNILASLKEKLIVSSNR